MNKEQNMNSNIEKSDKPSFIKISEQPSLYDDLEKKSVREILEDINKGRPESSYCRTESNSSNRETSHTNSSPNETGDAFSIWEPAPADALEYSTLPEIPPTFGMPPH